MAFLGRFTRLIGYTTAALAGISALLSGLLFLSFFLVENCSEAALHYYGCAWRGKDVSEEINWLVWITGGLVYIFLAAGFSWLVLKGVVEWGDSEFSFVRWWTLMILVGLSILGLTIQLML